MFYLHSSCRSMWITSVCLCAGISVHVCDVQLPGAQGWPYWDATTWWLHCRLLWTVRRLQCCIDL